MRLTAKIVVAAAGLLMAACDGPASVQQGMIVSANFRGAGAVGYAATDSNYRLVVAKTTVNPADPAGPKVTMVCAEAPADTATAVSTAISAAASASVKTQAPVSVDAAAQFARAYGEAVAPLVARSQGLALFRDGAYSLCQAYMNGALAIGEFSVSWDKLLVAANKLIEAELKMPRPVKQTKG